MIKINKLQKYAFSALIFGVILLFMSVFYSNQIYQSKEIILNVHVTGLMKTYHDLDKNGMHLVYGTTGQLFYHPKSFLDVVKYDRFDEHYSYCLMMIILAATVLLLSLKKNQVFFSKETIIKFYGVLGIYMLLMLGKWLLMDQISDDFYNATGHLLKLDIADGILPTSWQLLTYLFMFTVTGLISAAVEQKEKALLAV